MYIHIKRTIKTFSDERKQYKKHITTTIQQQTQNILTQTGKLKLCRETN